MIECACSRHDEELFPSYERAHLAPQPPPGLLGFSASGGEHMASVSTHVEYDAAGMPMLAVIAEVDVNHPDPVAMVARLAVDAMLRLVRGMTADVERE